MLNITLMFLPSSLLLRQSSHFYVSIVSLIILSDKLMMAAVVYFLCISDVFFALSDCLVGLAVVCPNAVCAGNIVDCVVF